MSAPALLEVRTFVDPVVPPLPPPVAGTEWSRIPLSWRLWSCRDFWARTLDTPQFVLDAIEHGYKLPIVHPPTRIWKKNSRKCEKHLGFIDSEIELLLKNGSILEVRERPWVVCSLSVDDLREKLRLIYNAIPINILLWLEKFKYEGLNNVRDMLTTLSWIFQFDIQSAYNHVRVHPDHWGLLGFEWRGKWFVYCVLPFGLATAPFMFTKITRPLRQFWREQGINIAMMLDDALGGAESRERTEFHALFVRRSLRAAGFTEHLTKCQWSAVTSTSSFLGHTLDLPANRLGIKLSRVAKLGARLLGVQRGVPLSRRVLASLAGQVLSCQAVLGHVARLQTRSWYSLIGGGDLPWDQRVSWSREAWSEVRFWRQRLLEGAFEASAPFWRQQVAVQVSVASDASDTGLGVLLTDPVVPRVVTFTALSPEDAVKSSTWRELAAIVFGLQALARHLSGRVVSWSTDNQAAALILDKGSRRPHLHQLAVRAFTLCAAAGIQLCPVWIPRELNAQADALSREVDRNDWGLTPVAFARLVAQFGPPVIDLFADDANHQVPSFYSHRPLPGSAGVDALSLPWPEGLAYACPPWALLGRVFRRLLDPSTVGSVVVILPVWPSQPWWSMLSPDGMHLSVRVSDWCLLDRGDFRLGGAGRPNFLTRTHWRFTALAVLWGPPSPAPKAPFCLHKWRGHHCRCACVW